MQPRIRSASPLVVAIASACLLAPAAPARERTAAPAARPADERPDRHVLVVRFDPASGSLSGTDSLTTDWAKSVRFQLHDGVSFSATCSGRKLVEEEPRVKGGAPTAARPDEGDASATWHELRIPHECADADGRVTIELQLQGVIHDPVEQEQSLHFVTGARTSGLISPDGIFLAGGTYWYPQTGRLETYDFTADVPGGWSVASQGARREPAEPAPDGLARQRYLSVIPADGLALSAGPYVVMKRQHGSIEIATFFLKDDEALAPLFLDAAEADIDRLAEMVGPYPYEKFDIVENFFTTGYGFPAYTLLGKDVIQMGPRALRPGYLDHEIAHVWFGNFVHVDVEHGNWCEGLVSYLTNYLGAARGGPEEALAARRRVSQRYSVDVPPAKDFAPKDFVTKTDDVGASVGYGKVSMVFHVLRRQLGDEAFWKGLRSFVTARGGKRGSWDDIEAAFEQSSGKNLSAFFAQWIGRAGLPVLSLDGVRAADGAVHGEIVQAGEPWALDVDVELLMTDGTKRRVPVKIDEARTPFDAATDVAVARATIDPDFDVPRRIASSDLPATLARTLAGDGQPPLVVHPDPPGAHRDETDVQAKRSVALGKLAGMLAPGGAKLMASKDVADADARGSSLLVLGDANENVLTKRYAGAVLQELGIDLAHPGSFRAGDRRWRAGSQSVLVSIPHPDRPGATITVFVPNGDEAVDAGRKLFYYGWDTWVAMDGGLAQQRGTEWRGDSATSVRLADLAPPRTAGERMLALVSELADPRLEGRDTGSSGALDATTAIATEMVGAGLEPHGSREYFEPFAFDLIDLPQQPVLKVVDRATGKRAFVPVMPAHAWIPEPEEIAEISTPSLPLGPLRAPARVPFSRGLVFVGSAPEPSFSALDLADSAGVVLDRGAKEDDDPVATAARLESWLEQAKLHNAVGLIVLRPDAAWPAPPALAAYATMPAPSVAKKREKAAAEGGARATERAAAGERARAEDLALHSTLPLIFGGKELTEALQKVGGLVRGKRTWDGDDVDVRFNVIGEHVADRNVVGLVRGSDPSRPVVAVEAHLDAVGELADGVGAQGAVDNASGVAVMLEVARRIAADKPAAGVVFIATSGEEWGLQGSRKLVAGWGDRPRVGAVVNVDSVGQAGKPLYVIGRSRWPDLAKTVEAAARAKGFEIGPDIDKYANRWGSDHWSWTAAGIPAIDVFQADYAVLNGANDQASLLDAATLERDADAVEAAVRELAR